MYVNVYLHGPGKLHVAISYIMSYHILSSLLPVLYLLGRRLVAIIYGLCNYVAITNTTSRPVHCLQGGRLAGTVYVKKQYLT